MKLKEATKAILYIIVGKLYSSNGVIKWREEKYVTVLKEWFIFFIYWCTKFMLNLFDTHQTSSIIS
jgi:hypothetical protein